MSQLTMTDHISTEDPAPYGPTKPALEPTCRWSYVDSDGHWSTACGHAFCFSDDDPLLGGFCFCPFCGQRLLIDRSEQDPVDGPLTDR